MMSTYQDSRGSGNQVRASFEKQRKNSTVAHPTQISKQRRKKKEGFVWQRWLTDPIKPDYPFEPTTLTLHDLVRDGWDYTKRRGKQPEEIKLDPISAVLPRDSRSYAMQCVRKMSRLGGPDKVNKHSNLICKGAIFGKNIYRFDGPYWSQIAQVMYQRYFSMETLRYVFFTNVENADTLDAVRDQVYRANNLPWPPTGNAGFRIWGFGEPEYEFLLRTRLGKAVVYLLLGAFPRGSWFVKRVATWGWDSELQVRFDVEKVRL